MVCKHFHLCADRNVRIEKGWFHVQNETGWKEPKTNFNQENSKAYFLTSILFSKYVWFGTFVLHSFCLGDFIRWGFGDNTEKIRLTFAKVLLQAIQIHRFLMNQFHKAFEGLFYDAKFSHPTSGILTIYMYELHSYTTLPSSWGTLPKKKISAGCLTAECYETTACHSEPTDLKYHTALKSIIFSILSYNKINQTPQSTRES